MKARYAQTINAQAGRERINPNQTATFAKFPNWLMRRKELSPGAKILYCRKAQYAGNKNYARVKQETLCLETGFSIAQVRRYSKELEHFGLIEIQQIGLTKSNIYYFLQHPWMNQGKEKQFYPVYPVVKEQDQDISDRSHVSGQEVPHVSGQEVPHVSGQEVPHVSDPFNRSSEKIPLKEHTQKRESVCVPNGEVSAYSKQEWFYYAKTQKNVHSPQALADKLAKSKENDHLMKEFLESQDQEKQKQVSQIQEQKQKDLKREKETQSIITELLALQEPLLPWQTQFLQAHGYFLSHQQIC